VLQRIREFLVETEASPRKLLGVAALAVVLVVILALPFLRLQGEVVEITGTVVAPFERPTEDGSAYYMRVTVEPGHEVRVSIPRTVPVRPGQTVVLTSLTGNWLGLTRYRFVRYVDAGGRG
jgi:hypothetical protein